MIHIGPIQRKDFKDIHVEDLQLDVLVNNLSMICRYAGNCGKFYSVAEHSVVVGWTIPYSHLSMLALFHDMHEAIMGDIIRPVHDYFPGNVLHHLKNHLDSLIFAAFKIKASPTFVEIVKYWDNVVLEVERKHFFPRYEYCENIQMPAQEIINNIDSHIQCMNPSDAYQAFMNTYEEFRS